MPRYLSKYNQAVAQRQLATLDSFPSLIDYWSANRPETITNVSGAVSAWRGLKQGLTWTQSTPIRRPIFTTYQGIPCLEIDYQWLNLSTLSLTNNISEFSIAIVYSRSHLNNFVDILQISTPSSFGRRIGLVSGDSTLNFVDYSIIKRLDGDTDSNRDTKPTTSNKPLVKVLSVNYQTNTQTARVDGDIYTGLASSSGTGNSSATNSVQILLGSGPLEGFNGRIYNLAFFSSALNLIDSDRVSGILAWMAGSQASLSASNRYATAPPLIGD